MEIFHIKKAAEQGDAAAQYRLGLCYEFGIGVDEDATLAAQWYQKAAEQGYSKAQTHQKMTATQKWQLKNKERLREYRKKWRVENTEKVAAQKRRWRDRRLEKNLAQGDDGSRMLASSEK